MNIRKKCRRFLQSLTKPPLSYCYRLRFVTYIQYPSLLLNRKRHHQKSAAIAFIQLQVVEREDQLLIPEPCMVTHILCKSGQIRPSTSVSRRV